MKLDASTKELVLREIDNFWYYPENQNPFLRYVDPALTLRLLERVPRQLDTVPSVTSQRSSHKYITLSQWTNSKPVLCQLWVMGNS